MCFLKKAVFIFTMALAAVPAESFTYSCHRDTTILVSGLPTNYSSMNYFAYQSDDGTNCTVTGNETAGTATINDCSINVPIYFTFGTYDGMLENQIQGGRQVQILNITCDNITVNGAVFRFFSGIEAVIEYTDSNIFDVTFEILSSLNVTTANVGDPVEWSISFPLNYSLEVTSCKAYPGTAVTTANSVNLIAAWCSSETSLISDFTTNADNTVASAVLSAFKFFSNENIYLTCDLKVCPMASSSCDTSCGKRRRRSSREEDAYRTVVVSRVLHVIDPSSAKSLPLPYLIIAVMLATIACLI